MIDHIGFNVGDFDRSKAFYVAALAPLGVSIVSEGDGWAMMGTGGKGVFWFGRFGQAPGHMHFAFSAADHAQVQAFHAAALAAGGQDNGAPGYRPQYHADYYAAFVIDPDGHNIEAVCHAPG